MPDRIRHDERSKRCHRLWGGSAANCSGVRSVRRWERRWRLRSWIRSSRAIWTQSLRSCRSSRARRSRFQSRRSSRRGRGPQVWAMRLQWDPTVERWHPICSASSFSVRGGLCAVCVRASPLRVVGGRVLELRAAASRRRGARGRQAGNGGGQARGALVPVQEGVHRPGSQPGDVLVRRGRTLRNGFLFGSELTFWARQEVWRESGPRGASS